MKKNTLVLGIGNTVLSDDAAGILVAREISNIFLQNKPPVNIKVDETSYGGWKLVDLLNGFDKVVIVDSILTGKFPVGECFRVENESMNTTRLGTTHGMGLFEAIEFARTSGQKMPREISVYGIEIKNNSEFSEEVTPEVFDKIPRIALDIIEEEKLLNSLDD